jgi:hypothetical protein
MRDARKQDSALYKGALEVLVKIKGPHMYTRKLMQAFKQLLRDFIPYRGTCRQLLPARAKVIPAKLNSSCRCFPILAGKMCRARFLVIAR